MVVGVLLALFIGFVLFSGYATHWSAEPMLRSGGDTGYTQTQQIAAPRAGDLARVRRQLVKLSNLVASPSAALVASQPAAAQRAHALRSRLIIWRDGFALTAHESRVLDGAIAYAGALDRWLRAPAGASHRAALKAWRGWRADDPLLEST